MPNAKGAFRRLMRPPFRLQWSELKRPFSLEPASLSQTGPWTARRLRVQLLDALEFGRDDVVSVGFPTLDCERGAGGQGGNLVPGAGICL